MSLRSLGVVAVCQRAAALRMAFRTFSAAANPETQADFLKGEPHRKHPGLTNLKTLQLPQELQVAARSIIHRAEVFLLAERARKLTNFLWSRKRMIEDVALRKKAISKERELLEKALRKGKDIDEDLLNDRIRKKVLSEMKRTTYRWNALKYDEELGVVYMAARLAGGYAAAKRALNEIKKRDPSFAPHSLLDFGSGLGTVAWAAHSHWADTLKEMVCVDSSGSMNSLAERLLKGDDENAAPQFKHVYFRQFLPVSPKVQFDLVVSAYTLSELPGVKDREDAIFTLWRKTSSYLVLVENGTKEGHQILMEARDTLLKKQEKLVYDSRPASVFAPCPHHLTCPKLTSEVVAPCNFQQFYLPLLSDGQRQIEKFSYLILSRSGHAPEDAEGVGWARLTAPVLLRTRHAHCHVCSPDGRLQHVVVTAKKHSRDVYRCARSSDWGDQLPLIQSDREEGSSDSE